MAWTELRERNRGDYNAMKGILKELKNNIEELCEMIEDSNDYGERDSWRVERERRGTRRYE